MNNRLSLTLVAAALAAVLSVSAAAQTAGVLQRCDQPMADAEMIARTVSECYAALAASRASLKAAGAASAGSEERITTSSSPLGVDLTRAAMTEPLRGRLVAHYAYAAFGAGDPSQCSALAALGAPQEKLCRRAVADLGFARARYGKASELVKACRRTDTDDGREGPASACCSLLAESLNRPDACSKLSPKCFDAPTCRAFVSSAAGSAAGCRSLPPPSKEDCAGEECAMMRAERVASCEADAAFARAFKAKNIAECAGSERCRALMGAGKAVAREIAAKDLKNPVGAWFLTAAWKTPVVVGRARGPVKPLPPAPATAVKQFDFKGFVCAEPLFSKENRQAVAAAMKAGHACLADVEAAASQPSRALAGAIDERAEKLIRLNLGVERQFEGNKPAKAAASAPK